MKIRNKLHLSYRILILFICMIIPAILPFPWSLIWLIPVVIALIFWILRPYFRLERATLLFLEGYSFTSKEKILVDNTALSPASKLVFKQLNELLSPSKLFEMNKRQAQYLYLQNQINPHFLYNTLEGIRSEAMLEGLYDVADMTESLATFFRYTITKEENLVSVEEELLNCETYFNIQQYRFGDRLKFEIYCSPEEKDDIFRCRIPKLTMQPILENCIIHGTELKIGTGNLKICLTRTEKRLLILISDDGLGIDEEKLSNINENLRQRSYNITSAEEEVKGGLALINVNNRIKLLFGDEYGLNIFSIPGFGTDVEISLPAITSDREIVEGELI